MRTLRCNEHNTPDGETKAVEQDNCNTDINSVSAEPITQGNRLRLAKQSFNESKC